MNLRTIIVFLCILSLVLPIPCLYANSFRPGQPPARDRSEPQAQKKPQNDGLTPDGAGRPEQSSQGSGAENARQGGQNPEIGNPESGQNVEAARDQAESGMGAAGEKPNPMEQPGQAEPGNTASMLYITALGKKIADIEGQPLIIPEDSNDIAFIKGAWRFERTLLGPDGKPLLAEFSFNGDGEGHVVLRDSQGHYYEAIARATVENGQLRIETGNFTSKTSSNVYSSEFVECRNGRNGAECSGTDGFGSWSGERLFRAPVARADVASDGEKIAESGSQESGLPARSGSGQSPTAPEQRGRAFSELADEGAELPPDIMKNAVKARAGANGAEISSLAGDWRFSQDLTRKSDGGGVSLEFHFDNNGNGYSLINDGSGEPFRAAAEASKMPNGVIRVKTGEYGNSSNSAYYPTFMECSSKNAEDLHCDVSNGWTRVENGRLVSLNDYEEAQKSYTMEDLLPSADSGARPPASLSMDEIFASVAQKAGTVPGSGAKELSVEDILAGVGQKKDAGGASAAKSGQDGSQATNDKTLQLPQKSDNASFMAGRWLCQTGLYRTNDGQPVVLEFSFKKDGNGQGFVREKSGDVFSAAAKATYRNGILRINTSEFTSPSQHGVYNRNTIECRNRDGSALCVGKNGDIVWDAVFLRQN